MRCFFVKLGSIGKYQENLLEAKLNGKQSFNKKSSSVFGFVKFRVLSLCGLVSLLAHFAVLALMAMPSIYRLGHVKA